MNSSEIKIGDQYVKNGKLYVVVNVFERLGELCVDLKIVNPATGQPWQRTRAYEAGQYQKVLS